MQIITLSVQFHPAIMFSVEFSFNNICFLVIGIAFDNTSSNSESIKGAAKLLEEELAKKLLYHACRHHIYELQIGAVWQELFDEVKGPDNIWFYPRTLTFRSSNTISGSGFI